MKKIALSFLVFLLWACDGSVSIADTNVIEPYIQTGKIKKITVEQTGLSKTEFSFVFDKKGILLSQTTKDLLYPKTTVDVFKRDSSGKITGIERSIGSELQTLSVVYKNGLVEQLNGSGANKNNFKYSYNADKELVAMSQTSFANNQAVFSGAANLEWQAGNIKTLKNTLIKGDYEEESWQYEQRENPIAAFFKKEIGLPQYLPIFVSKYLPVSRNLIFADSKTRYAARYDVKQILNFIDQENYESNQWKKAGLISMEYY
jgi:hypothetical protein